VRCHVQRKIQDFGSDSEFIHSSIAESESESLRQVFALVSFASLLRRVTHKRGILVCRTPFQGMLETSSEAESQPPGYQEKEVGIMVKEEENHGSQASCKRSGQEIQEENQNSFTPKRCKLHDDDQSSEQNVPQQHVARNSPLATPAPSSSVAGTEGSLIFPAAVQAMLDHAHTSGLCRQVLLLIAPKCICIATWGTAPNCVHALLSPHMDGLSRAGDLDTRVLEALRSLTEQVLSARGMHMSLLQNVFFCLLDHETDESCPRTRTHNTHTCTRIHGHFHAHINKLAQPECSAFSMFG
jgi:hypothetical protein